MSEVEKPVDRIRLFVEHSEQISGDEDEKVDRTSPTVQRHIKLAETLLRNPYKYVLVGLINAELTDRKSDWYRKGTDAALRYMIPKGADVPILVDYLNSHIIQGLSTFRNASEEDRTAFAWNAHDMAFCLYAFRSMNSRTARLLLNHVRVLLRLDILIITYEQSDEYLRKMREYRDNVFLPNLPHYLDQARRDQERRRT